MYLSKLTFAAFLSSASSFTIQCPTFTSTTSTTARVASSHLHSSPGSDNGWDNDNFLDALGGGQESIDNVNEAYTTESNRRSTIRDHAFSKMEFDEDETPAIFGGKVPGMPDPDSLPKTHDHNEENPSGGSMFQQMMEKAKQAQSDPSSIRAPPMSQAAADAPPPPAVPAPVPVAAVPAPVPVAPVPAVPAPVPVAANDMATQMAIYQQQVVVWQQQMTAFGQFSVANPAAAASMTMPPPPTPPDFSGGAPAPVAAAAAPAPVAAAPAPVAAAPVAPVAAAPAPVDPEALKNVDPKEFIPMGGGNKDAYEITNPADVYLAQLKRDSNVRTEARKRGDLEVANKPFADYGVQAIGTILGEELIARRREQLAQNGGEFETSRDEMIIPYAHEEDTRESNYTGISYRQKLEEMKKKRGGGK
jgi:hypothetical protein